jgi:hypothetical protein
METGMKICQSCGMPLDKDRNKGGTNADNSTSEKFCSFCYQNGKFTDEGITLEEKINRNVNIAVSQLNMPEKAAREMAESVLPNLERWKK